MKKRRFAVFGRSLLFLGGSPCLRFLPAGNWPEGWVFPEGQLPGKNKTPFLPERRTRFYPIVGNKIALWKTLCNYLNKKLSSTKDRPVITSNYFYISPIMKYLSKMPSNNYAKI